MLRVLMDNIDQLQEQMGNVSKEMKIPIKKPKEMLEIKKKIPNRNDKYLGWTYQIRNRGKTL